MKKTSVSAKVFMNYCKYVAGYNFTFALFESFFFTLENE